MKRRKSVHGKYGCLTEKHLARNLDVAQTCTTTDQFIQISEIIDGLCIL